MPWFYSFISFFLFSNDNLFADDSLVCRDFEMRLSCIERPQFTPGARSYLSNENWSSDRKGYDHKGDPEANFNALDSILKSSLDRLASLRLVLNSGSALHGFVSLLAN